MRNMNGVSRNMIDRHRGRERTRKKVKQTELREI